MINIIKFNRTIKILTILGYILFGLMIIISINNFKFDVLDIFRLVVFLLSPYILIYKTVDKNLKYKKGYILTSKWEKILYLFLLCFICFYICSYIFLFQEFYYNCSGVNSIAANIVSFAFLSSSISLINKKAKKENL